MSSWLSRLWQTFCDTSHARSISRVNDSISFFINNRANRWRWRWRLCVLSGWLSKAIASYWNGLIKRLTAGNIIDILLTALNVARLHGERRVNGWIVWMESVKLSKQKLKKQGKLNRSERINFTIHSLVGSVRWFLRCKKSIHILCYNLRLIVLIYLVMNAADTY